MKKGRYLFTIDGDMLILKQDKKYIITKNGNQYVVLQNKKNIYDSQTEIASSITSTQKNKQDIVYIIRLFDKYLAEKRQHGYFEKLKVSL